MLSIKNLCKTYANEIRAMHNISLNIDQGIYGLLGPNGAGKSTLMRTLATLQLPDSGTVRLCDIDLVNNLHEARKLIGYLPQELGVYPRVTAREMLDYIASLKGIGPSKQRRMHVEEQLERVNLTKDADRRLDSYSGGMKQRYGIAAAFLGDPRLVIIDEPTAGLDPYERRRFQLMLSETALDRVLVLSSHIVEDIAGLCQEMALLDEGQIVLSGSPKELTESLHGHVWEITTDLVSPESLAASHRILSWRPWQGRLRLRIWSEEKPILESSLPGAQPAFQVPADLEDLYAYHVNMGA